MLKPSLLLLLFFTSCSAITDNMLGAGDFSHADHFFERFGANKKAIVIMKYSGNSRRDPLYWCKVANINDDIRDIKGCRSVKANDAYEMAMVEPGIYKLAQYSAKKDDYIFGNGERIFTDESSFVFKAEASEVVYVGALKKRGSSLLVVDEFDGVRTAFDSKNYQKLSDAISNPLQEIEQVVGAYHRISKSMVKRLAVKMDEMEVKQEVPEKKLLKNEVKLGMQSCIQRCSKITVQQLKDRELRLKMDKHKYSKEYLKELLDDLSFDKVRCGLQ